MSVFYDVHCHLMNLSHPNLTAMLGRTFRDAMPKRIVGFLKKLDSLHLVPKLIVWLLLFLPLLLLLTTALIIALSASLLLIAPSGRNALLGKIKGKTTSIANLLAVMETDIGDCLIQLEEELRRQHAAKGGLTLYGDGEEKVYDRIVLTPLIMDFGLKNYQNSTSPYKIRWKPVVAQVEDLFLGIRDYYRHRNTYLHSPDGPVPPLFQIHPFMGLNTRNYRLQSSPCDESGSSSLEELLDKHFSGFEHDTTPEMRRRKLSERDWSTFSGNIESIGPHDFAGIKVYPPLGFNPWPEDGEGYADEDELQRERDKVRYLYGFCIRHHIPVTAHCSEGGFLVDRQYRNFSSPAKWAKVLEQKEYGQLRLNLAHFGGAENSEWRDMVAALMLRHENVYTDMSYQGVDRESYGRIRQFLDRHTPEERKRMTEKIIFGSDFMINLQDIGTYSAYLRAFAETDAFTMEEKERLCHRNAMRFLYLA